MKTIFNKEQCQDCVDHIRYCLDYHEAATSIYDDLKVLEQLINEHFELKEKYKTLVLRYDSLLEEYGKLRWNPPLKFEELHEGMWVWDNKGKCYRELCILFEPCKEYPNGSIKAWHELSQETKDFFEFEENRFYRYQAKENE